ncbi:LLM class flavin-dependent oxidoreductase [Gordonia sp. CPCC 205515]
MLLHSGRTSAVACGADSVWVPDHLNGWFPPSLQSPAYAGALKVMPHTDAIYEPWTVLGNLAARMRFRSRPLGIGVTDAGRRNPAVTAQAAATLHHLNRAGAILGLGPGEREGNEPYGVDWSQPVSRFEEAVATIRALWDSGGAPIRRESPFFPLRDATFAIPPKKGRFPEIWIGAHGPRMLRITGRYADGWFPAFTSSPPEYARQLATVKASASDHGRDPDSITAAMWFPCITGRNRDEIDETFDSPILRWLAVLAPDWMWRQYGSQHPLGEGFTGGQDIIPQAIDEATVARCVRAAPPALVRAMVHHGTADELVDQVAEWRDHGVRHVVASTYNVLRPNMIRGFTSDTSFLQALRRIRRL